MFEHKKLLLKTLKITLNKILTTSFTTCLKISWWCHERKIEGQNFSVASSVSKKTALFESIEHDKVSLEHTWKMGRKKIQHCWVNSFVDNPVEKCSSCLVLRQAALLSISQSLVMPFVRQKVLLLNLMKNALWDLLKNLYL